MDLEVRDRLVKARVDVAMKRKLPVVPIALDKDEMVLNPGEEVPVLAGDDAVFVRLKPITALFTGSRKPPSFSHGPTPEYMLFFAMIERTAIDYCKVTRQWVKDLEFQRLYTHLRRRPDGSDTNPIFAYLQAATRLYMSLRDVSREEFEAVAGRLALSAKHFSLGPSSTNYVEIVFQSLAGEAAEVEA